MIKQLTHNQTYNSVASCAHEYNWKKVDTSPLCPRGELEKVGE